jgi:hypothetical protein
VIDEVHISVTFTYDIHAAEELYKNDNGRFFTTGEDRTGCMFCAFGCHLDKSPNTFERMRETHPKQYAYCMKPTEQGGLGMAAVLEYIGVKY